MKKIILIFGILFTLLSCGNNIKEIKVGGNSMSPTIVDSDIIGYQESGYELKNGDIIYFRSGKDVSIKRIIGIPGDNVKIELGKVYMKNEKGIYVEIEELYLNENNKNKTYVSGSSKEFVYIVPENSYFLMGDNRNFSTDSRSCFTNCSIDGFTPYIKKEDIMGKIILNNE